MGALKMHDLKMTEKKTMGLENARVENDGQNYGVWKMQDCKMTDNILANSEQNYGVWKMQH